MQHLQNDDDMPPRKKSARSTDQLLPDETVHAIEVQAVSMAEKAEHEADKEAAQELAEQEAAGGDEPVAAEGTTGGSDKMADRMARLKALRVKLVRSPT